jgi:DNA-binding NtrC family response regulator
MNKYKILVADSDSTVADCIVEVLADEGYQACCLPNYHLTMATISDFQPDLLIMEQWHGAPHTRELLHQLEENHLTAGLPVIINTTNPRTFHQLAGSVYRHNCLVLLKPFDLNQLIGSVESLLKHHSLMRSSETPLLALCRGAD